MSRRPPWDPGGTLSGRPSLYDTAPTDGRRRSAGPDGRRTARPSRRANRAAGATTRITAAVRRVVESAPDREVLAVLDTQLRRLEWRDHSDALASALERLPLPAGRLRLLGRWLARHGEHPNAVRTGILLLGMAGTDEDRDTLLTLGVRSAFSAEVCEALQRSQSDPQDALFTLARRGEGWARVDAVGRLGRTTDPGVDPDIREWLVRAACTGDVLDSYFALTAAISGDLAGVLARDVVDKEMLEGAGRLLEALTDIEGPCAALSSYRHAQEAMDGYLRHTTARPLTLPRLFQLILINRYFDRPGRPWPEGNSDGYDRIRSRLAQLIRGTAAQALIRDGLADAGTATFHQAAWAARHLGLPLRPALLERAGSTPCDATVWYLLLDGCPEEEIAEVVATAERLLQDADAPVLDTVVSRLDGHPGLGWKLIRTALGSRRERNRRMALRAIRAWPRESLPAETPELLRAACEAEPVADLGKAMRQELLRL
ncbi:hypothetical protein [Streptomyces chattanoogensis]|uniref:Uncharacterized protein n=1 Tax=Streptomyces chattanoogensis TaxID=66876 RepID=A0A0N0XYK4_9ACTN|nr:hypothetical protein [Streptomyces chattanoogensis]KPC63343.1 hypothetical protein ADL29_15585 [Streptomyces chattanoogensis]